MIKTVDDKGQDVWINTTQITAVVHEPHALMVAFSSGQCVHITGPHIEEFLATLRGTTGWWDSKGFKGDQR